MLWTLRWKRVLRLRNAPLGQFYVSTSRNMFPVNLNHLIKLFGLITWIIRRKYSKFSPSPPGWLAAPLFYCEDWWPLIFENKSCKIINKNVSHKFLLIRRRADTNYREKSDAHFIVSHKSHSRVSLHRICHESWPGTSTPSVDRFYQHRCSASKGGPLPLYLLVMVLLRYSSTRGATVR